MGVLIPFGGRDRLTGDRHFASAVIDNLSDFGLFRTRADRSGIRTSAVDGPGNLEEEKANFQHCGSLIAGIKPQVA